MTDSPSPQFIPAGLVPTPEQRDIQLARQRVCLVHANAGAAKTTTLALRVGEALARGLAPQAVLALTFTPEARQVMRARLQEVGLPAATVAQLPVLTLDELAQRVLARLEDDAPLPLLSARELKAPALDALEGLADAYPAYADQLEIRTHDSAISQFLDSLLNLKARLALDIGEQDEEQPLSHVAEDLGISLTDLLWAQEFERLRLGGGETPQFRGPWDATYDLARLLRDFPESADALPACRLVVADELHDLNEAAYTVLETLLARDGVYFVGAGDRDQVIHSRLGADEQYLDHRFAARFPATVNYPLTVTWRHGPHLAHAMEAFKRKPVRSGLPVKTDLHVMPYPYVAPRAGTQDERRDSPREEAGADACAQQVVAALRRWKADKHPLDGCAILLRDRHQSIAVENALMQADIGYRTQTMSSYLRREEILFLRGMLAVALDNLHTVEAMPVREAIVAALALFGEVPMTPEELAQAQRDIARQPELLKMFFQYQVQRVGAEAARRRMAAAIEHVRGLPDDAPAHEALLRICADVAVESLAQRLYVHPYDTEVVTRSVQGFVEAARVSGRSLRDFAAWIGAADAFVAARRGKNLVLLECVESAKGKEFDHVVLPFLSAGEFPHPLRAAREEENLFYVAATRARLRLTLITPADEHWRSPYIARMDIAATRARSDAAVQTNQAVRQAQAAASSMTGAGTGAARAAHGAPQAGRRELKVSYADKEHVKKLGARWDPTRKVWYAPDGVDIEPLRPWLPTGRD
ncbi:3'-5' exonuclease [Achromobacter aloeverae]|uniref:DNA 3'-5' helicase n=1 Tax=Achromobacter aloeverae TaxID=1750518 RepID=A0A4Q1HL95_9BURK|nr:ATP-dependent helicase [Achromobacter aloeverae]RXN90405.1 ATP-dependent helicase [Achromobacter aloeverae]